MHVNNVYCTVVPPGVDPPAPVARGPLSPEAGGRRLCDSDADATHRLALLLQGTALPPLAWQQRLRAVRDATRALVFLHTPTATKPVVLRPRRSARTQVASGRLHSLPQRVVDIANREATSKK